MNTFLRKHKALVAIVLASTVIFNSCAIMPLSRKFTKWSAESCGRKNILERLCSGVVMIVTTPVYFVTFAVDLPVSLIEFFSGAQLIQDPLIKKTAFLEYRKDSNKIALIPAEDLQFETLRPILVDGNLALYRAKAPVTLESGFKLEYRLSQQEDSHADSLL